MVARFAWARSPRTLGPLRLPKPSTRYCARSGPRPPASPPSSLEPSPGPAPSSSSEPAAESSPSLPPEPTPPTRSREIASGPSPVSSPSPRLRFGLASRAHRPTCAVECHRRGKEPARRRGRVPGIRRRWAIRRLSRGRVGEVHGAHLQLGSDRSISRSHRRLGTDAPTRAGSARRARSTSAHFRSLFCERSTSRLGARTSKSSRACAPVSWYRGGPSIGALGGRVCRNSSGPFLRRALCPGRDRRPHLDALAGILARSGSAMALTQRFVWSFLFALASFAAGGCSGRPMSFGDDPDVIWWTRSPSPGTYPGSGRAALRSRWLHHPGQLHRTSR